MQKNNQSSSQEKPKETQGTYYYHPNTHIHQYQASMVAVYFNDCVDDHLGLLLVGVSMFVHIAYMLWHAPLMKGGVAIFDIKSVVAGSLRICMNV